MDSSRIAVQLRRHPWATAALSFVAFCWLVAVVAAVGFRRSVQLSGGMAPTIKAGESVTIDYLTYIFARPHRWDVVALEAPFLSNRVVIKRVVGLPLETISLTTNGILVNDTLLAMPAPLTNAVSFPPDELLQRRAGLVKFPYAVPPKHYFVIGDNWPNSLDSRYYGSVPVKNILGRVPGK